MRMWILFSGILIGEAINPGHVYPTIFYIFTGSLFMVGFFADIREITSL